MIKKVINKMIKIKKVNKLILIINYNKLVEINYHQMIKYNKIYKEIMIILKMKKTNKIYKIRH